MARALDDGINHDKQSKKAFYIKAIVGFFAVLLLVALVLLALNWFSALAPAGSNTLPAAAAPLSAESLSSEPLSSEPAAPLAAGMPDEQARKALQQLLSDTNHQVNQLAADTHLAAWQSAAVNTLVQNMQQAYRLYGQQLYSETGTLLQDIQQQSSALRQNYTQAYEAAYQTASAAFANSDLQAAQGYTLGHLSFSLSVQLARAATPALAIWASCAAVTPDTPTEPMTWPSTTTGTPPSSEQTTGAERKAVRPLLTMSS